LNTFATQQLTFTAEERNYWCFYNSTSE